METIRTHLLFWSVLCSARGLKLAGYLIILLFSTMAFFLGLYFSTPNAHANSRLKDIVAVQGIRDNLLVGYGLVVGLNGTGDKINNIAFTEKSLTAFLERLGIKVKGDDLKTKNVAAVSITASLPPFARAGSRIDVRVSTMGDATNLQGGVLLASPLMGADGEVYAVAQGPLAIEGFGASGGDGTTILKGVPTNGYIANGAIVEREIAFDLDSLDNINLALRNPDISTAKRISKAINTRMKNKIAVVKDPGTVTLEIPERYQNSVAELLAKIELVTVQPDQIARIVVDEASGTVVMGENVRIDTVAIAQGNLVVRVRERPVISQPGAFAPEGAETVETTVSEITVTEEGDRLTIMPSGTTLDALVGGLNALGVGPRDLISILQTIKAAGAMQADIEAR